MKFETIDQLIEEKSFYNLNKKSKGLDSFDNYRGDMRENWIQGASQSRDSELIEISNFESCLEFLGGEKKGGVEVIRFGHWGCGWIESIQVHKNNSNGLEKLKEYWNQIEKYPVFNEDDYYERENEEIERQAEWYKEDIIKILCDWMGLESEDYLEDKQMLELAYNIHRDACDYNGVTDGFLSENLFKYNAPECINYPNGNVYAEYLKLCFYGEI